MAIRIQRVPSDNLAGGVAARLIAILLALIVAAIFFALNGADLGKLAAETPKFVIESDASIVAPLVFALVLGW